MQQFLQLTPGMGIFGVETKNIPLKKATFLIALLLWVQALLCQEAKQYSFTHYSVSNGLAAYNTSNVIQDDQGYIWIGTANGLQRFDGSRFLTFRHNPADKNSLTDNGVWQILYDKQNNLWVLLGDGSIGIFDTRRFIYKQATVSTLIEKNLAAARRLIEDSDGRLILTFTFREALTYNKVRNEFASAYNAFTLPPGWKPTDISDDPTGKRYLIGSDSGLAVYNRVTKKLSYRNHNAGNEPIVEQFKNVYYSGVYHIDTKGRAWLKSWPPMEGCYIFCYDLRNSKPVIDHGSINEALMVYNEPTAIYEQKDGTIWITGLQVFMKFDEAEKKFIPVYNGYLTERSISYEAVTLFEDRETNMWVTTTNNGLYVFNPSKELFNSIGHLNRWNNRKGSGGPASFIHLKNGDLLVGCWGDGLYRYDKDLRNIKLNIRGIEEKNLWSPWAMCLLSDSNTVCIVGQAAFIAFYDQAKNTMKRYEPAIFETRTIRQVVQDRFGNLWFGSQSKGLYKWSAAKGAKKFEDGLYKIANFPPNSGKILKLIVDSKGYIWVGTEINGVFRMDPGTDAIIEHFTHDSGPASKRIMFNGADILEYNDSLFIIAGSGLNFYNTHTNTMRHVGLPEGLPSRAVVSLQKDRAGYLWIGMTTGLCRMNIFKGTFTQYNRNDGITNDNFDISTDYQMPDGRLLFGSSSDFVVFNPLDVRPKGAPPMVKITEFSVQNKSLLVDSLLSQNEIELAANENSIAISYSILSYFNESKPTYYYMLENIDKGWKKGNELNQAIYSYLPAGTYTFRIRAENADAVSSKEFTLRIRISPPFWKSWWFYGLLTIACIVIFYLADRERLLRFKSNQKLRTDIALNLHHDVNTALGNINLLSEMARMKADKDIGRTKELIEQISFKSNDMMIAMDDILWVIDPANDSMEKTLLRMSEFIDSLRNRHEAEIDMHVDEKVKNLKLGMKDRHGFFFIFKTALRCMVQYSGARQVLINIDLQNERLCLKMYGATSVKNTDGIIFKCIEEMKAHAAAINAELDMQQEKGGGNIVLMIPVK